MHHLMPSVKSAGRQKTAAGWRRVVRQRRRAFTLLEIMVVVAIFVIIAAIGITQLLRARIVTNEQLALTSLRLLSKSSQFFFLARQAYPASLAELGPPTSNPAYVDDTALLAGAKQGYQFVYAAPGPGPVLTTFTLLGNPLTHGSTGVRHFFVDQTMVIHATEQDRDATAADPVIPNT